MIVAGALLLLRLSPLLATTLIASLLLPIASITPLYASLMALASYDLKRVVAYSTCSHVALSLYAASLLLPSVALYHLLCHASAKALLFMASGLLLHASGSDQDARSLLLSGLPLVSVLLLLTLLILTGIPGSSIYSSKDSLLLASLLGLTSGRSPYALGATIPLVLTASILLSSLYSCLLLSLLQRHAPM